MSRFFRWLIHPLFLALVGVVAISLVIWFGADYVKFGDPAEALSSMGRLVVILAVWMIGLIIFMVKLLTQRKKNDAMVEAIQEDTGPSASDEEAQVITDRFKQAMGILKTARFEGRQGRRSVYQLPWYVIIGPPGAGKTTALVNSGLHFPLKEKLGIQQIGGIGGTRNCDWWFTDEAVIIDTAGRYTTQDSDATQDKSAWNNFLGLLRKYRTRRPINGVILAVSVQDLLSSSEAERQQHAERIRLRLQELPEQFSVKFPIYILFTKADLIAGFNEFFEDLTNSEREQVWGMTFPFADNQNASQTADYFIPEFDALVRRLNDRVIWRAHRERDTARRSKILGFPGQVENLRGVLDNFIKSVFTTSRFEKQSILRGVYFTSGTQEGRPIDRILANLSSNYGINYNVAATPPGSGKSFFIHHLMKSVVFPESELATLNVGYEKKVRWVRRVAFALMALVFAGAVGAWTTSVLSSQALMEDVQVALDEHSRLATETPEPQEFEQVIAILQPLQNIRVLYQENNHPWISSLGLYDSGVVSKTDITYDRALRHFFRPMVQRHLEGVLVSESSNDALYDALRVYLMLGDSSVRDIGEVKEWFSNYWAEKLPGQAGQQDLLKGYLNQMLDEKYTNLALRDTLVERTRSKLRTIPIEKRIYKQIQRQPEYAGTLNLRDDLGVDMRALFNVTGDVGRALQVPLLYTKAGYNSLDLSPDSDLVQKYSSEQWILGAENQEDFSDKDVENIVNKIKALYFADYIQAWSQTLSAPEIGNFSNLQKARDAVALSLDRTESPINALLNRASKETLLTPKLPEVDASGRAGAVLDAAGSALSAQRQPTPVDEHFRPLHKLVEEKDLERYTEKLQGLFDKLEEISLAPNSGEASFKYARGRFAGSGEDPIKAMRITASRAPSYLKGWLETMGDQSWKVILGGAKGHLNSSWNREVYSPFQKTLARSFPFASKSSSDAALSDFSNFFKPDGVEESFVKANIRPFVDSRLRPKAVDGRTMGISNSSLNQIRQAAALRQVFFGDSGGDPSITFQVKPHRLDNTVRRFDLEVGTQRLRYTHGPQLRKTMQWPTYDKPGARIVFEDLNETLHQTAYDGDWGLFRLLEDSTVEGGGSARLYQVGVEVERRKAQLELLASSTLNPFSAGWIKQYRCPESL
ncbi:type VI secretion system membrane subunit TssM [Hahella ganghwensis]|uniref:type VI secretion system membrane subunit TssM n=1 Tax=Hahella ganghwensis TaxID=286420 RepID=UPI000368ECF5|nr:type VI secretion system membrane subunit TssM [Hahella ganghwensis]